MFQHDCFDLWIDIRKLIGNPHFVLSNLTEDVLHLSLSNLISEFFPFVSPLHLLNIYIMSEKSAY